MKFLLDQDMYAVTARFLVLPDLTRFLRRRALIGVETLLCAGNFFTLEVIRITISKHMTGDFCQSAGNNPVKETPPATERRSYEKPQNISQATRFKPEPQPIHDRVARARLSGVRRVGSGSEEGQRKSEARGQAVHHRAVHGHGARQRQFILAGRKVLFVFE